ncbi:MAG: PQQ-like beta-propeller repeat protein [Pirellulales bacterium]|nr:PQQ-like beta-propeller repeat protein [Pirellulales bacterium]
MNPIVQQFIGLAALLLLTPFASVHAEDWPQFRGPGGQGYAAVSETPLVWSETENVIWKVTIPGRGWSSPVVAGGRVWLTTAVETPALPGDLEKALARTGHPDSNTYVAHHVALKAIAIDLDSGRLVHDTTLFEFDQPILLNKTNSYASPTPVADEGRVYCDFGAMGTVCVDAATGKMLWSRRLAVEHQVGPGSSPTVYRNLLILVRDGCDEQYVAALDTRTGETVWKTPRPPITATTPSFRKAFSTPLIFVANGKEQMVAPGAQWIVSYRPTTGEELWRVDTGDTFSNTSRPVYGHGMVYVCTAYGGSRMLAIRTDGTGDVTESHVAWQLQQGTPQRPSPLLVAGRLYFVSDRGVASCVDAVTGEVQWSERLGGAYAASGSFAAGRIYFFSENGVSTAIRPGDRFERLAENRLDGRIMASPAFVERGMLVRTDTHLYRIGRQSRTAEAAGR